MKWMDDAMCADMDTDVFFPEGGEAWKAAEAKWICSICTVRAQCLEYALENNEIFGIWGGLTTKARFELKSRAG